MATNKNAVIRYQALDKCFRNPGRKYYIEDLVEACSEALMEYDGDNSGIQKRQVYDDILFMKDSKGYDAPIEEFKDGKKVYRRYSDLNFTINKQPINEFEANQLKETLLTLNRFKGMPQFEWVNDIITRLESSFGLLPNAESVIDFENNPYLEGLDFLLELFKAITYKKTLYIKSKSFSKNTSETLEIHPYYLKQYNNRWFIFGLNTESKKLYKKAIDRIETIEYSNSAYIDTDINFDEYFDDVIGVTVTNEAPVKVKLRIHKDLWPYIKTKPFHPTQSSGDLKNADFLKDGYIDISILVIPNYELETKILEHGDKIEVIAPVELRAKIANRVLKTAKKYQK
jgi:predicted DNA-binding transcriptional regulator YafY